MTNLQKRILAILAREEKEEEEKLSFGFIRINTHEEDNKAIYSSTRSSCEYD